MAITFDAADVKGYHSIGASFNVTVANLPNRYILGCIHGYSGASISRSMSYAGIAMPQLRFYHVGTDMAVLFGMVAPAPGVNSLAFATNPVFTGTVSVAVYNGVDQIAPYGTMTDGILGGTLVSQVGRLGVAMIGAGRQADAWAATLTPGAGETLRKNYGPVDITGFNNYVGGGISDKPGAAALTLAWSKGVWTDAVTRTMVIDLLPAVEYRGRNIRYMVDTLSNPPIITDAQGAEIHPSEIYPDNWMFVSDGAPPTSIVTASNVDDPRIFYIEEATYQDDQSSLRLRNSRGQLDEVIFSRRGAAGAM